MTTTLAALGQFGEGIEFIFNDRPSVGGDVRIGGLAEIRDFGLEHLKISAYAIFLAVAVASPIGLYLGHKGRGQFLASAVSNAGRAVPILVLIGLFIAYLGIGTVNIVGALTLLAIPPILANAYVGARQVDPEIVDAAEGMGMTGTQIVWRVRLPLAMSTYMAGVRLAVVSVLATAAIAPLANVQTLGEPIVNQAVYGLTGAIGAAIVIAVLTVTADGLMALLQSVVTPKGTKLEREGESGKQRRSISSLLRREQPT